MSGQMKMIVRYIALVLLVIAGLPALRAAEADTCIYFINIYPGNEIYELEGHSAIGVSVRGQEPVAFNYGVFDFDRPNFVYRFVKGETDYKAVAWPLRAFLASYNGSGRRIVAHELNLDSAGKKRLVGLLLGNVRPENATYRYNYVKNNCATRPLAVVERAAGDSIILGPAPFEAQSLLYPTFRNVMRRYHANYPWYQFGIDLALGSGIDYTIDRRAMAFAPAELDGMLAGATVGGRPLVRQSHVLVDTAPDAGISGPTPWYLSPLAVCTLFLIATVGFSVRDFRRRCVCRVFDAVFFGVLGLAGCLLTFLIFISTHEATSPNWLYAWLNPLCLLVPLFVWCGRCRVLLCYHVANAVVLAALLAAWYWLPQSANAAFLPILLADALRSVTYVAIERRHRVDL